MAPHPVADAAGAQLQRAPDALGPVRLPGVEGKGHPRLPSLGKE